MKRLNKTEPIKEVIAIEACKLQVTPEQSAKVQEICFKRDIAWLTQSTNIVKFDGTYLFVRPGYITYGLTRDDSLNRANPLPEISYDEFVAKYDNF